MTDTDASDTVMESLDRRLLLLSEADNVVVTCENLKRGDVIHLDGARVTVNSEALLGFKIARRDLAPGDKVLKYGAVIGSVTAEIRRGDVVHLHNMKSDYLPAYGQTGSGFTKR
jgi:hypothetical protein